jgi:hypothetical protein
LSYFLSKHEKYFPLLEREYKKQIQRITVCLEQEERELEL